LQKIASKKTFYYCIFLEKASHKALFYATIASLSLNTLRSFIMNEIKLSTQKNNNSEHARLVAKLDLDKLDTGWSKDDIIRVISNRTKNTLIFQKVSKKHSKQVAYKATSTGSGEFTHNVGLYINYTKHRFSAPLAAQQSINAAVRKLDGNRIEVYLPEELFA
jgi:hypothetical protein